MAQPQPEKPNHATSGRVLVTGATGRLGRAVVPYLAEHGWDVLAVDRVLPGGAFVTAQPPQPASTNAAGVTRGSIKYTAADIDDFGSVVELLSGFDESAPVSAIVHLAAIPAPGRETNAATFANNVPATYNIFRAAQVAGIKNVVWASSETVLGLPFEVWPPYVPVDEEYAPQPQSTYSLGKALEEEMAQHFTRWDPELKVIGLRFSNVMHVEDYQNFPAWQNDPKYRRWNMWSYIDARDGAQAVLKALAAEITGFEVFIIANADNVMTRDSTDLLDEEFPGITRKRAISGRETLLSIDKARRLLGYEPVHSWQDELNQ